MITTSKINALNPLDNHSRLFLEDLCAKGYAEQTLRKKRPIIKAFCQWCKRRVLALERLKDEHIDRFVARLPRRRQSRKKFELAVMRLFFDYLRQNRILQPSPPKNVSPVDTLLWRYLNYLRNDRGLAENSLLVYAPFIRSFLANQSTKTGSVSPQSFTALTVRDFIVSQVANRPSKYIRLLAVALRSFLRFLFLSGKTSTDLSGSVPTVRVSTQTAPPPFLSPEQVEQVLAATNRGTATGRRDYAILLLLARLGLRAGEAAFLRLDDIDWHAGEILLNRKGKVADRQPLPVDVGEAIAAYLHDRGTSSSRRVFLRTYAPRIGLAGPAAIGSIVRYACTRAGIRRLGRGAAHLFRHGLATKMIRHGSSLREIAEVLGHRSLETTAIYSHVSFDALRTVALPWPVTK